MLKKLSIIAVALVILISSSSLNLSAFNYINFMYPYGLNGEIDGSTMTEVTNTSSAPYNAIAYLVIDFPECTDCHANSTKKPTGTGFMISPTCMITAGHNLVCRKGHKAHGMEVYFDRPNNPTPYYNVTTSTASFNVLDGYNGSQPKLDAGYVVFNTPYTTPSRFFSLTTVNDNFFTSSTSLRVTGYRQKVMYTAGGKPAGLIDGGTRFQHMVSTLPGLSGSPVVMSAMNYVVVGIHTTGYNDGEDKINKAWRITQEFIDMVKDL